MSFFRHAVQDIWKYTGGFWTLVGEGSADTRVVKHVSGVELPVPPEVPLEATLVNPQSFHRCSLETKSGLVVVPVVNLLKANPAKAKQIKAPFFADAVQNQQQMTRKTKKSPKKKIRPAGEEAEEISKSPVLVTPRRRKLRKTSSDASITTSAQTPPAPPGAGSAM